ncbi:MAG: hypothetical protein ACPIOQ_36600, partial [Promethearchaeia archaeon]
MMSNECHKTTTRSQIKDWIMTELKKLLDNERVDYAYQSVLNGTAGAVKSALKKKHPFSSKILIL